MQLYVSMKSAVEEIQPSHLGCKLHFLASKDQWLELSVGGNSSRVDHEEEEGIYCARATCCFHSSITHSWGV